MRARTAICAAAMMIWLGRVAAAHEEKTGPLSADDYTADAHRLAGTYKLIGRLPKLDKACSGTVMLVAQGKEFKVTRTVAGKTTKGRAFVDVDPVGTHVLIMEFMQGGRRYEGTYLFTDNFDSWTRLTGHVAAPGHSRNDSPDDGLEALFPSDDPACGIDA